MLPIAGARVLKHSLQCLKEAMGPNTEMSLNTLGVQPSCLDPLRLVDEGRKNTIAFIYPSNGHLYIAMNMDYFKEYVST